ncbi:hypothetical protein E2C01_099747 [Portunus trituberculatus]|uniref:Uncharacterized protein n=1 Tax=Portunus trituberculatus TaxID=210409 RepID=A0A5B7KBQ2_PORTR|nr:hypothetical protein [Portunus trituberculatus]
MRALWSEESPSARVRILSTVRVQVGLPHSGQRVPSGWAKFEIGVTPKSTPFSPL